MIVPDLFGRFGGYLSPSMNLTLGASLESVGRGSCLLRGSTSSGGFSRLPYPPKGSKKKDKAYEQKQAHPYVYGSN